MNRRKSKSSTTLNASDLAVFAYCARSLGYQRAGYRPDNEAQLEEGTVAHREFGEQSIRLRRFRRVVVFLIVMALLVLTVLLFLMFGRGA